MEIIVTTRYYYTGETEYTVILNEEFFNSLTNNLEELAKDAEKEGDSFCKDDLTNFIEMYCCEDTTLEQLIDPKHKKLRCDLQDNVVKNIDALVDHFSYLIKEEEIFEEECCTLAKRGNVFYKYCPMCGTKLQRA